MADLSFLPRGEVRRRAPTRWPRLAVAAVVSVFVSAVLWYYSLEIMAYYEMQDQLAALELEYQQINWVQDLQNQVSADEAALQQLQQVVQPYRNTARLGDALVVLNESTPAGMVLEGYTVTPERTVQIVGRTPTIQDVARFQLALLVSELYSGMGSEWPAERFWAGPPEALESVGVEVPEAERLIPFVLNGTLTSRG